MHTRGISVIIARAGGAAAGSAAFWSIAHEAGKTHHFCHAPVAQAVCVPALSEYIPQLILSTDRIKVLIQLKTFEYHSETKNFPAKFSACDITKKSAALLVVSEVKVSFTCFL